MSTRSHKKLGVFFIATPFVALFLSAIVWTLVNFVFGAGVETEAGDPKIINWILAFLGLVGSAGIFILVPIGILLVVKSKPEPAPMAEQAPQNFQQAQTPSQPKQ